MIHLVQDVLQTITPPALQQCSGLIPGEKCPTVAIVFAILFFVYGAYSLVAFALMIKAIG